MCLRAHIPGLLHGVTELLPHQAILENFVHHNPLRPLESMNFKEALDYAQRVESYITPGERVFAVLHTDPRKRVNEALADLSSAFLDRGAAKWAPKFRNKVRAPHIHSTCPRTHKHSTIHLTPHMLHHTRTPSHARPHTPTHLHNHTLQPHAT